MSKWEQPTAVNVDTLLAPHPPRKNFNIIDVDQGHAVRVAKVIGRFPWHYHPGGDEGWMVWTGKLQIDTEAGPVLLNPGDFTVIPCGMRHSPIVVAEGTTVVIFNSKELGMVLDEPNAEVGEFQLFGGREASE